MINVTLENCEFLINKQKHQIDKKVLRQDQYFSFRLNYADKKIREMYYSMAKTTYKSIRVIINKLQSLKGKTKLKFYQDINNYSDELNIRKQSGTFQY